MPSYRLTYGMFTCDVTAPDEARALDAFHDAIAATKISGVDLPDVGALTLARIYPWDALSADPHWRAHTTLEPIDDDGVVQEHPNTTPGRVPPRRGGGAHA